ncbi:MAG: hypothetical protein ACOY3P_19310 [Planctomycetota bacterium]
MKHCISVGRAAAAILALAMSWEPQLRAAAPQVDGPYLLHREVESLWGGHTFSYLIQGERGVFWAARDPSTPPHRVMLGQHPLPGSNLPVCVRRLDFSAPGVQAVNPPQLIRTPDGYLHAFVGVTVTDPEAKFTSGRLRYWRSRTPEDCSAWEDRSDLIPREPFGDFHLRMNVGISVDGRRLALPVLAISKDNSVKFNTPVVFLAERDGLDFRFQPPRQYTEPTGLFYPQVACTRDSVVIVGQNWTDFHLDKKVGTALFHLDMQGKLLHREEWKPEAEGALVCHDMRPEEWNDFSHLDLYLTYTPANQSGCRHDFYRYESHDQRLVQLKSVPVEYSQSNAGKWLAAPQQEAVFVNNPSMSKLVLWPASKNGITDTAWQPMPQGDPLELGYAASSYILSPNALTGSLIDPGYFLIATDALHSNVPSEPGRIRAASLLLWRISWQRTVKQ